MAKLAQELTISARALLWRSDPAYQQTMCRRVPTLEYLDDTPIGELEAPGGSDELAAAAALAAEFGLGDDQHVRDPRLPSCSVRGAVGCPAQLLRGGRRVRCLRWGMR